MQEHAAVGAVTARGQECDSTCSRGAVPLLADVTRLHVQVHSTRKYVAVAEHADVISASFDGCGFRVAIR
jgi:hypothetical protein